MDHRTEVQPGDGVLHPMVVAAVAILVINDHVLKGAFPGTVTGKLSDFAGLVFFPLFLVACWELMLRSRGPWRRPAWRPLAVACAATAVIFTLKALPAGSTAIGWLLGSMQWAFTAVAALAISHELPAHWPASLTSDPWDLVALPALGLPFLIGAVRIRQSTDAHARATPGRGRRFGALLMLSASAAASLATSYGPAALEAKADGELSFSDATRSEVRTLHVRVDPATSAAKVTVEVLIQAKIHNGQCPVTLAVRRDSDGASVRRSFVDDCSGSTTATSAGFFSAIPTCNPGQVCTESFTLTFTRATKDKRPSLAVPWSVVGRAEFPAIAGPESPPEGARLFVYLSR